MWTLAAGVAATAASSVATSVVGGATAIRGAHQGTGNLPKLGRTGPSELAPLAPLSLGMAIPAGGITGELCVAGSKAQTWTLSSNGQLQSGNNMCLSAPSVPGPTSGIDLAMVPCPSASESESESGTVRTDAVTSWTFNATTGLLTPVSAPATCVNLEGYATAPGSTVWLYNECTIGPTGDCKGNCQWKLQPVTDPDQAPSMYASMLVRFFCCLKYHGRY